MKRLNKLKWKILFEAERLRSRTPDKVAMFVARKLPKRIVYMAYVRVMAHATTCPEGLRDQPDEVTYSMALDRWKSA